MLRTLSLIVTSAVFAGAAAAAVPEFETVDGNEDGLISLGEASYFLDDVDVATFVRYDTDADAFLSPDEFAVWRAQIAERLGMDNNS